MFRYDDAYSQDHDFEQDFASGCRMRWRKRKLQRYSRHIISYRKHIVELPEKQCRKANIELVFAGHLIFISGYWCFGRSKDGTGMVANRRSQLAAATNGVLFKDSNQAFSKIRNQLQQGYPEAVRLRRLAQKPHGWHSVAI
ncbi:MAG: DUF4037 domain-containing protein [Ruminococcus sp.]